MQGFLCSKLIKLTDQKVVPFILLYDINKIDMIDLIN